MNLIPLLIAAALMGGWIYLLKYVYTKAREQNTKGEEFRTGRPPTWRIVFYCLIAVAIPLYFTYPDLNKLQPQIKILLLATVLILPAFIIFIGVILPAIVKQKKAWLGEHKKANSLLVLHSFGAFGLVEALGHISQIENFTAASCGCTDALPR